MKVLEGRDRMQRISIVIPVYNAEKSLSACIESIQKQTYDQLEILLIDDGSTDSSNAICKEYADKDHRIRVINKSNGGVSSARNLGIKEATGKYIQFVDSDDYIEAECCQTLVEAMEVHKVDMVICGCVEHRGEKLNAISYENKVFHAMRDMEEDFGKLYRMNLLNIPWNKLFLREKIKKLFDEEKSLGEDLLFNLFYMKEIESVSVIQETPYHYMIAESSLSRIFRKNYMELSLDLYDVVRKFCEEKFGKNYQKGNIAGYFTLSFFRGAGILIEDESLGEKEKKNQLKNWLMNPKIIDIIKEAKCTSKQEEISRKIVLLRNSSIFYWALKAKKHLKRNNK